MNTKRRATLLPAIAAVLMITSSASAQSTYFKYELCTADKYVNDGGVAINQTFYKKFINAGPMPVLSSDKVPDTGLVEMANWIRVMTANLPASMVAKFSDEKVRAVVMHETEGMKVVPEYSGIIDEDVVKQRYFYPTDNIPVMVAGAENVLNYGPELDRNHRECLAVHAIGIGVMEVALFSDIPTWKRLTAIYAAARDSGKYDGFFPQNNFWDYWGMGSQAWFSCSAQNPPGANTREEIKSFDPELAEILAETYGDNAPFYRKPDLNLLEKSIVPCGSGLADLDGDGKNDVSAAPAMVTFSTMMGALSAMAAMLVM